MGVKDGRMARTQLPLGVWCGERLAELVGVAAAAAAAASSSSSTSGRGRHARSSRAAVGPPPALVGKQAGLAVHPFRAW